MTKFRMKYLVWALILGFAFFKTLAETPAEPKITSVSIQGTNVVVKVATPAGLRKVSIETRSRLEASTWAPKAVKRFDEPTTEAQELTFTLPRSDKLEVLRVRADATDALPAQFFKGTNQFAGPQSSSGVPPGGAVDTAGPNGAPAESRDRSVVESDIWKISGDTLYFFNNLRGLQILDVSNPATPTVKATFPVPASGEQMYVLESGHAVLLTRSWCGYNASDESKVLIVNGAAATPTLSAEAPVPGWIAESRMVGDALYVVSQSYYQHAVEGGGTTWEPRTFLTSIDLTNPAAPVRRSSEALAGYSTAIYATDRYLVSATWNYTSQAADLQLVDISSPTGEFAFLSTIRLAGAIADKFKVNIDGDTLTTISHKWDNTVRWTTTLENFSLANPRAPVKVGSLQLAEGEQLHATRFDGKRAYVVTYLRIDPLWIVDLSDPTKPKIAGELHVPGWSTYLHPLGDRVLALGIDDTNSWRVAVSLFDVSNTAEPKLLSKVALGENYSWSEANYDEKAMTVLPGAGLVLVPYQGYMQNGYASHVQLIDLAKDSLKARGQISDHLYPRRATLHRDHIVSISGREFISYDAANRDQPALKARIDLAWPVNKVLLAGEHLIELETGDNFYGRYWYGGVQSQPIIRVARADAPETILSSITLTNPLPIAGAELRDGKLYVAQSQSYGYYPVMIVQDANGQPIETNKPAGLHLSVWDVSNLPNLTKLSETAADVGDSFGASIKALWPKPNLLVWTGGSQFNGWWMAMDAVAAPMGVFPGWGWGWGGGAGGRFAAFDVANASSPTFKSHIDLTTNGGWNFSKAMVVEGLVYLSHQTTEQIPVDPPPAPAPTSADGTSETNTASNGWGGTNQAFIFVTKYFLDVIDFADPASPVVRKPVNIPGSFQGASHEGGVVYTVGYHFDADGRSVSGEWLDASAYDGVSAYLVDSLSLTNWPHPVVVNGGDIFVGQPTALERWQLSAEGMLQKLSTTGTKEPVYDLRFFGDLVGVSTGAKILLFDATNRAVLKAVGESGIACHGAELDNADGALGRGLWIPQNDYGVMKIGVTGPVE
jgi:hypothetical protein